jgi:hypothetical protein
MHKACEETRTSTSPSFSDPKTAMKSPESNKVYFCGGHRGSLGVEEASLSL